MLTFTRFLVLFLLLGTVPHAAHAASFILEPQQAMVGQEFSVLVAVEPEGEAVNAIEGTVYVPEGLTVTHISTGGSAFPLWLVTPAFSRADRSVSFVGGAPGSGVPATGASTVFTIHLIASAPGSYTLIPGALTLFRADGTGSRVPVSASDTALAVGTESVVPLASSDGAGPWPIVAVAGSDPSLFDGAPFVSFYAADTGSGVVGYTAKEGWFAPYVEVDRYYVLESGSIEQPVWIRAVDADGNSRSVRVAGVGDLVYYGGLALPLVLIGIVAFFWWRRRHAHHAAD